MLQFGDEKKSGILAYPKWPTNEDAAYNMAVEA